MSGNGIDQAPVGLQNVEVNFEIIHGLSMKQLESFERDDVNAGYGMLTCALTLARLHHIVHDKEPDTDAEAEFVENLMDWCAAYFAEGVAN